MRIHHQRKRPFAVGIGDSRAQAALSGLGRQQMIVDNVNAVRPPIGLVCGGVVFSRCRRGQAEQAKRQRPAHHGESAQDSPGKEGVPPSAKARTPSLPGISRRPAIRGVCVHKAESPVPARMICRSGWGARSMRNMTKNTNSVALFLLSALLAFRLRKQRRRRLSRTPCNHAATAGWPGPHELFRRSGTDRRSGNAPESGAGRRTPPRFGGTGLAARIGTTARCGRRRRLGPVGG